ncbi:Sec63 Brl domain-containing protein [Limtongia smithiae]|uniref:Sec63 Brl domain-containing protein n=1 Tax=Limtongia smithiae TaxID=1125753 RepID=UPI0034CF0D8E
MSSTQPANLAAESVPMVQTTSVPAVTVQDDVAMFMAQFQAMKSVRPVYQDLAAAANVNTRTILIDDDREECVIDGDWDDDYQGFLTDSDDDYDNGYGFSAGSDGSSVSSPDDDDNEGVGGSAQYDEEWLTSQCVQYLARNANGAMDLDELVTTLKTTLTSNSSVIELQSRLADILGYGDLEFVAELISHRAQIVDALQDHEDTGITNKMSQVSISYASDMKQKNKNRRVRSDAPAATDASSYDAVVKSKLLTREERQRRLDEALKARKAKPLPKSSSTEEKYPHVYRAHDAGNTLSVLGNKYSLPAGTERTMEDYYEEITVPYPKSRPLEFAEKLVQIEDLDHICRETFKGYKSLNRVQSLVYPIAYGTNSNMLICAPTGAGKTDVAMLTVLHTIAMHCIPTPFEEPNAGQYHVEKSDFKIVYVAPLKALAAEIVEKLGKRLKWLGISVRELTGDMQLTRAEVLKTQIIVTTPEKWDVVTRKSNGDTDLVEKVKLLIIDEVHMLHDERGAVIESLVSRTQRQVETTQKMIRIVGLSATLPNYVDVADFLKVDRREGLFYFDASFRPVPLEQHFLGVKGKAGSKTANDNLDKLTYKKVVEMLQEGHQIMVFVHSRKDTMKTVKMLREMAMSEGDIDLFDATTHPKFRHAQQEMNRSKSREIRDIFRDGFGVHHAGMLRADRNLMERLFTDGVTKVLCCTATLAWGVNLPAAAVVIKGTQVYDAKKGGFTDLGITDVIQIFGRAGRPQFEKYGIAFLCTTADKLSHYLSAVTQQHPIESRFQERMVDNLNAEISLGTITTVDEGVQWLGYTYLYVRMRKNPMAYGIEYKTLEGDVTLGQRRRELIVNAARQLHKTQMIIFDERTDALTPKDVGRIASEFYLMHSSIEVFNTMLRPMATTADVLAMLSYSGEFDGLKAREEEVKELTKLLEEAAPCQVAGTPDSSHGKINILLQAYITRANIESFSLTSDTAYIAQNAARITRALFLIALNRHWGRLAECILSICKAIDKRLWPMPYEHYLAQFNLPKNITDRLCQQEVSIEAMRDMNVSEIGDLIRNRGLGATVSRYLQNLPYFSVDFEVSPIIRNILRVHLNITPLFTWNDQLHGSAESFWVWVEDSEDAEILHASKFILTRKHMNDTHELDFFIPLADPLPAQVYVRLRSTAWAGGDSDTTISFQHLIQPENENIQTKLLDLRPLPVTALQNPVLEAIYQEKFNYFNPMQTMVFHCLYNTPSNVLLGSPTGSGKTVAAELAMFWAYKTYPKSKVVYVAPMKALVRERVDDWRTRLEPAGIRVVELTGDSAPDARSIRQSDVIITTPEKFDGITRNWKTRKFVQEVSLIIMDEIHLLASERGPILEMIVSRMNYVSTQTNQPVRLVGMSTAVANAGDMAGWLNLKEGLFNFPQSIRPVPLKMYIDGFQDNTGFCPLMKSMNRPAFMAIKSHSPTKPCLIFVASRRQTRLTAADLINFCGAEDNPKRFLQMSEEELMMILSRIKDEPLKLSLQFGIGQHHAGLVDTDRKIVQELFTNNKIQVLIATSTLAWGVNLPAHLVIIKGTQFFDGRIEAYKDMNLTDILQMMGRAGRPAFDTSGVAMIFTQESKKPFYRRFLHTGFPVESSLHKVLDDHLGAEIASGTIKTRQQALNFLTCTYLFRRVHKNPTYYGLEDTTAEGLNQYFIDLVDKALSELAESGCIRLLEDGSILPTAFLQISSYYYISHKTVRNLLKKVKQYAPFELCLQLLAEAAEYDLLSVRHNEDLLNVELSKRLRYPAEAMQKVMWDPHVKAFLLIQAHLSRAELPISDYMTDMVSVLDQSLRILQAYIDITGELGYTSTCLSFIDIMQSIKQAVWFDDNPLTALPGLTPQPMNHSMMVVSLRNLSDMNKVDLHKLAVHLNVPKRSESEFLKVLGSIPIVDIDTQQSQPTSLVVRLTRKRGPLSPDFKCYTPKFPKPQFEGWLLLMSAKSDDELLVIKRVYPKPGMNWRTPIEVVVDLPPRVQGRKVELTCVSDVYLLNSTKLEIDLKAPRPSLL